MRYEILVSVNVSKVSEVRDLECLTLHFVLAYVNERRRVDDLAREVVHHLAEHCLTYIANMMYAERLSHAKPMG